MLQQNTIQMPFVAPTTKRIQDYLPVQEDYDTPTKKSRLHIREWNGLPPRDTILTSQYSGNTPGFDVLDVSRFIHSSSVYLPPPFATPIYAYPIVTYPAMPVAYSPDYDHFTPSSPAEEPPASPEFSTNRKRRSLETQEAVQTIQCKSCAKPIASKQFTLIGGNSYHPSCFCCVKCRKPVGQDFYPTERGPCCEADYTKDVNQNQRYNDDLVSGMVIGQPATYQIANYNIHPVPAIELNKPLNYNMPVNVCLIEATSNKVVHNAFQAGEERVIPAKTKTIYLSGLKLSKMGPIKSELATAKIKQTEWQFRLRVTVGGAVMTSDPFKVVSSCSQLPQEVREVVRPSKRTPSYYSDAATLMPSNSQLNFGSIDSLLARTV